MTAKIQHQRLCFWCLMRLAGPGCFSNVYSMLTVLLLTCLPLAVLSSASNENPLRNKLPRSAEASIPWFTVEPASPLVHIMDKNEPTESVCGATAKIPVDVRWLYWDIPSPGKQACSDLECAQNVSTLLRTRPEYAEYLSATEGIGEATLTLSSSSRDRFAAELSQKTFFCVAENSAGITISRRTNLKFISTQIVNEGVQAVIDNPVLHQGHTAVFTCKINPKNNRAYYTLEYWHLYSEQSDQTPIRVLSKSDMKYSVISNVENPELHVRNVESADFRHFFKCIFRSKVGTLLSSSRQHLTEIQSASSSNIAMVSPANIDVTLEATHNQTTVELPCVASPNPTRYTWYRLPTVERQDRRLDSGNRNGLVGGVSARYINQQLAVFGTNKSDETYTWVLQGHGNLIINNINAQSTGVYKCVADFGGSRLAITVNLNIYEKLGASINPSEQSSKYMDTVEFKCDIAGAPISSVTWLHNGRALDSASVAAGRVTSTLLNHGRSSVLTVQRLSLEDRGAYQCFLVRTREGTSEGQLRLPPADNAQAACGLILKSMPPALRGSSQPQIIQVLQGESQTLWCDFAGEPSPQINWKLDGLDIEHASRLTSNTQAVISQLAPGVNRATLTHTFTDIYHTGLFSVIAKNNFGLSSCNFTVIMLQSQLKIRDFDKVQAVEGRPLRLSCYVLGGLNAGIPLNNRAASVPSSSMYLLEWHFQKNSLTNPLKLPRDHRMHLDEKPGQNEVVISSVEMGDAGQYSCTVRRNGASSSVSQKFEVLVFRAPVSRPLVNSTLDPIGGNRLVETCTYENDADAPVLAWWSVTLDNTDNQIILRDDRNTLDKLEVGYVGKTASGEHSWIGGTSLPLAVIRQLPAFMRENNNWNRYVGRSASLNGNRLTSQYAGRYICNVINPYGLATSVKHVKFNKNYEFQEGKPPNQKDVILGQRVNVSCLIRHDNGEVPLVDWFLRVNNNEEAVPPIQPNTNLTESELPNVYQVNHQVGQTTLIIQRLQLHHKNFLCVTRGLTNTKSAAFNPNIKLPAQVQAFANSSFDAIVGSTHEFDCRVTGNLPINITWYAKFDDSTFSSGSTDREKRYSTAMPLLNSATSDAGFCQLTSVYSYHYYPTSSNEPPNCRQILVLLKDVDIVKGRLVIRNVHQQLQGVFRCNASNEFNHLVDGRGGPSSAQFQFIVIDRPDPVRDFQADESKTTARSVFLKFREPEKDGNKAIKYYLLEYQDLYNQPKDQQLANNMFFVQIFDLHPGHTYNFQLFAINAVGRSEAALCQVTTHQMQPTGPVLHLHANATHYNKVVLSWKQPNKEHINSRKVQYALYYRQLGTSSRSVGQVSTNRDGSSSGAVNVTDCSDDSADSADKAKWQSVGECDQLQAVIFNGTSNTQLCHFQSHLRAFTEYQFGVLPTNSKGHGPRACVSVRTLESAPNQPPSNVSCESGRNNEIMLKWIAPKVSTINGVITSYQVQVVPEHEKLRWDETNLKEKDTSATELLVRSLDSFTNYSFTVTVSNSRGRSVPSKPIFCLTRPSSPDPPKVLKLKQHSANCFLASWMHSPRANGVLLSYVLRLYVSTAADDASNHSEDVAILQVDARYNSSKTFQVESLCLKTALKPNTKYTLRILSNNHFMEGPVWSAPASCKTAANGQPEPSIVSFSQSLQILDKDSIELDCVLAGLNQMDSVEPDQVFWEPKPDLHNSRLIRQNNNFVLSLNHVKHSNQYTCRVAASGDYITYTLTVAMRREALPNAPQLLAGRLTNSSLEVKWRTNGFQDVTLMGKPEDPTNRVTAFRVNFTNYYNGSHTESRQLDASKRSFIIDPVNCGTLYGFSIAALNKFGWSSWSSEQKLRTKGSAPIQPRDIKRVAGPTGNVRSVEFNFSAVEPGDGCAPSVFYIFYHHSQNGRQLSLENSKQVVVNVNELQQGCCYTLKNLNPATHYVYRVSAINAAGNATFDGYFHTVAQNGIKLNDPQQRRVVEKASNVNYFASPTVLIPTIFALILIVLFLLGLFLLFKRHHLNRMYEHRQTDVDISNKKSSNKANRALPHQPVLIGNPQPVINNPWSAYAKSKVNQPLQQNIAATDDNNDDDDDVQSEAESVDSKGNINPYATFHGGKSSQDGCIEVETDKAPRDLRHCREERSQLEQRMQGASHLRYKNSANRRSAATGPPLNLDAADRRHNRVVGEMHRINSLEELDSHDGSTTGYSSGAYSSGHAHQRVGGGGAVQNSAQSQLYYGAQTDRLVAQRASHLSSITTVSSNHDELSEAYSYGQRYRLPPVEYEDSQHTSGSSETTDSGIRRFTQEPPQPEEQRHATCEVPLYGAGGRTNLTTQQRRLPRRLDSVDTSDTYESVDAYTLTNGSRYGGSIIDSSGRSTLGRHPMLAASSSRRHIMSNNRGRAYSEAESYGTDDYESADGPYHSGSRIGGLRGVYGTRAEFRLNTANTSHNPLLLGERQALIVSAPHAEKNGTNIKPNVTGLRNAHGEADEEVSELLIDRQFRTLPHFATPGSMRRNINTRDRTGDAAASGGSARRPSLGNVLDDRAEDGENNDYDSAEEEEIYTDTFTVV